MPIGVLFSGQGAQKVGMGKSLAEAFPQARARFEEADAILGFPLSRTCFEGPAEELTKTSVCQPALYVHGFAVAELLRARGVLGEDVVCLGLSLGELTAHAFAGTFDFATGLRVVAERGRLMQQACEASAGAMASVIGGSEEQVRALAAAHDVDVANLNNPGQVVISGEKDKVAAAVAAAKAAGTFRMVVPLDVAGAYHSRLMEPARAAFERYLAGVAFRAAPVPVLANVTGKVAAPADVPALLARQVTGSVRWEDCMRTAASLGCTRFFECGPGGVLAGLAKRTDKAWTVTSVAEAADLPPAA